MLCDNDTRRRCQTRALSITELVNPAGCASVLLHNAIRRPSPNSNQKKRSNNHFEKNEGKTSGDTLLLRIAGLLLRSYPVAITQTSHAKQYPPEKERRPKTAEKLVLYQGAASCDPSPQPQYAGHRPTQNHPREATPTSKSTKAKTAGEKTSVISRGRELRPSPATTMCRPSSDSKPATRSNNHVKKDKRQLRGNSTF